MTLSQIETELENDLQHPGLVALNKIALYTEIVLVIVQFAKDKGVWKDGKVNIRWTHWIPIIGLFRRILGLLRAA